MKRAYIVQGIGESTGCRLMTKVLMNCGCNGTDGHVQQFQSYLNDKQGFIKWLTSTNYNNFVCRFSYPHGKLLPDIKYWYDTLVECDYKVYIILTTRSWPCQQVGTVSGKHLINNPIPSLPTVKSRITQAYKAIFGQLSKIENGRFDKFVVVNMGDILQYPEANLKYLSNEVDLSIPDDFDYTFFRKNADSKRAMEYLKRN